MLIGSPLYPRKDIAPTTLPGAAPESSVFTGRPWTLVLGHLSLLWVVLADEALLGLDRVNASLRPHFLHIPKTGGTALNRRCGAWQHHDFQGFFGCDPPHEGTQGNCSFLGQHFVPPGARPLPRYSFITPPICSFEHLPPRAYSPSSPFEPYHALVCVIRHPYDRFLSAFRMEFQSFGPNSKARHGGNVTASFEDWANTRLTQLEKGSCGDGRSCVDDFTCCAVGPDCHLFPQYAYVFGQTRQERSCRHVLRYEYLAEDYRKLMTAFGNGKMKNCVEQMQALADTRTKSELARDRSWATEKKLDHDSIPESIIRRVDRIYDLDFATLPYQRRHNGGGPPRNDDPGPSLSDPP